MSRKKQLEYRRNCSKRNMGMNDNILYLAVDIRFEQLLYSWILLICIVLLSLAPRQSTASGGQSSSTPYWSETINERVWINLNHTFMKKNVFITSKKIFTDFSQIYINYIKTFLFHCPTIDIRENSQCYILYIIHLNACFYVI